MMKNISALIIVLYSHQNTEALKLTKITPFLTNHLVNFCVLVFLWQNGKIF